MVDQHDVDRLRRLGDVENRVGHPVDAGHVLAVEPDFLPKRAAYALHDIGLDRMLEAIRIYDLAAVMGDRELPPPDLAARAIDIDLGDDRDSRPVALHIGDAAPADRVASLVLARRGSADPARALRHGLHQGDVARVLDMAQAELDVTDVRARRHPGQERFAGEVNLRADGIAQMRAAQG